MSVNVTEQKYQDFIGLGVRIFRRTHQAKEQYERASYTCFAELILAAPFPLLEIDYISLMYLILPYI